MSEEEKAGNKPVLKLSAGLIGLAVFEYENKDKKTGEPYITKSIVLQKRYKDADGNWQNAKGFNPTDLPIVAALCDEAVTRLIIKVT